MTDAVPPGDVPGKNDMRASDADRERVAEQLRDAMAEGRLDMDEFQERLEAVYRARTYGELIPVTRDLPGGPAPAAGAGAGVAPVSMAKGQAAAEQGTSWAARVGGTGTSRKAFAFWSGFQRRGRWTMPRSFKAFAMMGGGEIDLREATFEARDVTIECYAFMGGMQVTVPPGLNVRVTGIGILGGFEGTEQFYEDGDPDAPTLTIKGFAVFGGVGVVRKLPRDERKRLGAEARGELDYDRDYHHRHHHDHYDHDRREYDRRQREYDRDRREYDRERRQYDRDQRHYERDYRRDQRRYGDRRDY